MQTGFYKTYSTRINPFIFYLILFFVLFIPNIFPQTPTNLEQFYSLTDSIANQIFKELPENQDKIYLEQNLGEQYSLFSNHIKTAFIKSGIEILETNQIELSIPKVNIVIEDAKVEYGEMFRDGWFGAHYVERKCELIGNYLNSYSLKGKEDFHFSMIDTVKVEEIKNLENDSFPFTKGNIPPEPFLSGLAEPLIAIVVAAAVVILFFTQRSK